MKLGALGLPAYRTFSLEEVEEATNNFDTSTFMGEGSHGQVHRYVIISPPHLVEVLLTNRYMIHHHFYSSARSGQ